MKYQIVLADPPWFYWGSSTKDAAAGKHYDLMPDEDMLRLDIASYLEPRNSILFVWATGPRKGFAYKCIEHWGLFERGEAFHWVKTRKDGAPVGAQGVRASITKPTVESVLAASFLPKGRPLPIADEKVCQTIFAPDLDPVADWLDAPARWAAGTRQLNSRPTDGAVCWETQIDDLLPAEEQAQVIYAPRGEHSEKPEEIYTRIERMYPNATKLELFARKARPGWDSVGNQLDPPSLVRMRPPGSGPVPLPQPRTRRTR